MIFYVVDLLVHLVCPKYDLLYSENIILKLFFSMAIFLDMFSNIQAF